MTTVLGNLSRLVTARPWITIALLLLVTVALAYGATFRAPPTEGASVAFLPTDHPLVTAADDIAEHFSDAGEVSVATVIFRGDAFTPEGLSQMAALLDEIARDPAVAPVLAHDNPIFAPSSFIGFALQVDDLRSVTQEQINTARSSPPFNEALDAMTGTDTDGSPASIATITLINTGDERVAEAERRINELATEDDGPLSVSSVSPIVTEDEYKKATEEGMGPLIGLALLLIAVLLVVFTRSLADMGLTLAGLVMSITWIVGAEGWLGPNALGLIGPPSSLTAVVPVVIISLTVDYAIQSISHYREMRLEGAPVVDAVRRGLRNVTVPLTLAAVTTIVSMFAARFSPISVIGDFGIVAGLGVGMALIVMLTLLPAGRLIIDRRREARGRLGPPRTVSNALPGIPRLAQVLGRELTRRPVPYIIGVIVITSGLGFAATDLRSEFNIRDILPRGGDVIRDLETLDAAVGGSTEMTSIIIKAEATETRTLLNVDDLTAGFANADTRPEAAAGPIQASYELLLQDWTEDSGAPGDKYDPEMDALFREAHAGLQLDTGLMQQLLDRLEERDPAFSRLMVNNPNGSDIMLLQFPAFTDDLAVTGLLQEDIEARWFGEDDTITATSLGVLSIAVGEQITEGQTGAVGTTVAAALTVLAIFFWVTLRQPALSVIAVGPIVLVLISVLGTMALVGIPYSLITSIITALSIGIGVDYTIHIIHRYREEYAAERNPEQAAIRTLATTGSALLGSALTTALGFGVLIFSPLVASQQFGITATITIVYSLIISVLLVLPAMVVWGSYQNVRLRSQLERIWEELDEEIDATHRRHEAGA